MSLTLAQIPDHDRAAPGAGRTSALRDLTVTGGRRTVLRAVALAAVTLGTAALDLAGAAGTRPARAETGEHGLRGWDRTDCRDAYPDGYGEAGDTSGRYVGAYAACFGGNWRGSAYCESGWHKYGSWHYGDVRAEHVPTSTACGANATRNAWKWSTPDGKTYRCSDGYTTYYGDDYNGRTYLTICRS